MKNDAISLVLPVYDLADVIGQTLCDTYAFLSTQTIFSEYEVILIDDGSRDETAVVLKEVAQRYPALSVVTHAQNQGYGAALLSGLLQAQYPLVLFMDADGQFKASALTELQPFLDQADVITGFRARRRDSLYRIILGKIYTWLACRLFGLNLKDINCGFKLFKKDHFQFDALECHAGVFYTDFFIQAKKQGCRIKEVPIAHYPRLKGRQTGASLQVMTEALRDVWRLASRRKNQKN